MFETRLSFSCPPSPLTGESVYVGAWQSRGRLHIQHTLPAPWAHLSGENWFLASSTSDSDAEPTQFIHQHRSQSDPIALAFRGYLSNPSLPHWAPSSSILEYWKDNLNSRRHNGVFSASIIDHNAKRLTLVSDAFGLAPFYYRRVADTVLFSTSARFLIMPDDRVDELGAGWLFAAGQLLDDRSLVRGIHRVPAGSALQFDEFGCGKRSWFSLDSLPQDPLPIDDSALSRCEEIFQESMRRIERLGGHHSILPLSSGDDSRRILSGLLASKADFKAITVRTSQRIESRDMALDAYAASQIAEELGFSHLLADLPRENEAAGANLDKCYLMSGESTQHDWFVSLTRQLPEGRAVIYDGAGGDVFGNTGYGEAALYTGKLSSRISNTIEHGTAKFPSPDKISLALPSMAELRADLASTFSNVPDIQAASDLLFLRMRTRRGPGFKQQALIRGGNLTACPYFDLDHVEATLPLDANAKLHKTIQSRCLERYWPDLYRYPGTRRLPSRLDDVPTLTSHDASGYIIRRARAEARGHWFPRDSQLGHRHRLEAKAADFSESLGERNSWWLLASSNISRLMASQPAWKRIQA